MLASANEMAKLAYDQEKTGDTIIDSAEKSVFGLSSRRVRHDAPRWSPSARIARFRCVLTELADTPSIVAMSSIERWS